MNVKWPTFSRNLTYMQTDNSIQIKNKFVMSVSTTPSVSKGNKQALNIPAPTADLANWQCSHNIATVTY